MINQEKLLFLKKDFILFLKNLKGNEKPAWGVMDPQQMTEHMGEAFLAAAGRMKLSLLTPLDKADALVSFVMSEKDFKPNTKNALMSETPAPHKFKNMQEAIVKLEKAIAAFEENYRNLPGKTELNPFFGPLSFEQQIQLLHKHTLHHMRQFGWM